MMFNATFNNILKQMFKQWWSTNSKIKPRTNPSTEINEHKNTTTWSNRNTDLWFEQVQKWGGVKFDPKLLNNIISIIVDLYGLISIYHCLGNVMSVYSEPA